MPDPTEPIRHKRLVEINSEPGSREALEAKYGKVWDTKQLAEDFLVVGFMAPFIRGTLCTGYNGINEWLGYERGHNQQNRLNSLWFGDSAKVNRFALETALAMAV